MQTLAAKKEPGNGKTWICPMRQSPKMGVQSPIIQLSEPQTSRREYDSCAYSVARKIIQRTREKWEVM